jgi:hypothetical protein
MRCRVEACMGSVTVEGISHKIAGFNTRKSFRRSRTGLVARLGVDLPENDRCDSLVLSDSSVIAMSDALCSEDTSSSCLVR